MRTLVKSVVYSSVQMVQFTGQPGFPYRLVRGLLSDHPDHPYCSIQIMPCTRDFALLWMRAIRSGDAARVDEEISRRREERYFDEITGDKS